MSKFNVHLFREMRLFYPDIEADSPEDAARIASETDTDEAEDINDCNSVDLGAMVDLAGDEFFTNSQTIDFEPQRMLNAAPKLLAALIAVKDADYLDGAYQPTVDLVDAAIAEATNGKPSQPQPIVVNVRGGVVVNVQNVPPGYQYEVLDHDDREEAPAGEAA